MSQQVWRDKYPSLQKKVIKAEHRPKFCSSSLAMMTYPSMLVFSKTLGDYFRFDGRLDYYLICGGHLFDQRRFLACFVAAEVDAVVRVLKNLAVTSCSRCDPMSANRAHTPYSRHTPFPDKYDPFLIL